MNQTPEWRLVRIGLLVAGALCVAALVIVGITSRQKIFERKVKYYSLFPDAAGLKDGSGVWYQGVEVGFITQIAFTKDVDSQMVRVNYKVSANLVPRIRSGTRASVRTLGLLGDKYLALYTPADTANEPIILPGHEIPIDKTVNLAALGRGAQDLIENTIDLSKNINKLVGLFVKGEGAIPRLLNDPKLGRLTIEHLNNISQSLDRISTGVASGRGLAGKIISDRAYGDQVAGDLADSVRRTNEILASIQAGKGGAGAFVSENGKGEKIVENLARTSETLQRVAASIDRPGTLGNKLFLDDEYGEHLASNLLSISDSLASILKKIDSGQGTLGALINDRQVYDSLSAVADGINQSAIVKWYLKRKAKKAARHAKKVEERQQKGTHQ
jgi:phospholipid/cholesterol/gamma-HCH transport system substrate-binding protein